MMGIDYCSQILFKKPPVPPFFYLINKKKTVSHLTDTKSELLAEMQPCRAAFQWYQKQFVSTKSLMTTKLCEWLPLTTPFILTIFSWCFHFLNFPQLRFTVHSCNVAIFNKHTNTHEQTRARKCTFRLL